MTVPVWFAALLLLTGVSTENDESRTTVRPSPSSEDSPNGKPPVSFAGDVFAFACTSVCGNAGKVLQCELKTNGECAKRYYVVCSGKDHCQWDTIQVSCEETRSSPSDCERFLREKEASEGKIRRRSETGLSYLRSVGIVPALRRRFSGVRRRDLGDEQLNARSGMAMTSGNAHAYALDNNNLVESHYGRPAVYSPRPENDILPFPFSFIPRLPNFKPSFGTGNASPPSGAVAVSPPSTEQPEGSVIPREPNQPNPPQPVSSWSGYQTIPYSPLGGYATIGHYPMYHQPNGYNQPYSYPANDDYSMWGNRPRQYSPFTSFFNAVGLQDPMLLLQYLPVG